jgi:hypothetical protein
MGLNMEYTVKKTGKGLHEMLPKSAGWKEDDVVFISKVVIPKAALSRGPVPIEVEGKITLPDLKPIPLLDTSLTKKDLENIKAKVGEAIAEARG